MAIELTNTNASFVGTGAPAVYTPGFYANSSEQVKVYVDGALQTIGDDYTLDDVGAASGVVVEATFPNGSDVYIERDTPITQLVDTQNNETILEDVIDAGFDKLTMIAQELQGRVNRTFLIPNGEVGDVLPAAELRANNIFGFGADGQPVMLTPGLAGLFQFTADGVGAVARLGELKLREASLSPEDFSGVADAVEDGTWPATTALVVGTNNAVPIAKAFASLTASGGGELKLKKGRKYLVYGQIVPAINSTLNLNGGELIIVLDSDLGHASDAGIRIVDNFTLRGPGRVRVYSRGAGTGSQAGIHAPLMAGEIYGVPANTVANPTAFDGPTGWRIEPCILETNKWIKIADGLVVGSIAGTTMTVTARTSGFIYVGMTITGAGITEATVLAQLTGSPGDVGTYTVSVAQAVASTNITLNSRLGAGAISIIGGASDFHIEGIEVPDNPYMAGVVFMDWGIRGNLYSSGASRTGNEGNNPGTGLPWTDLENMNQNKITYLAGQAFTTHPHHGRVIDCKAGRLTAVSTGTDRGSFAYRLSACYDITFVNCDIGEATYQAYVHTGGDLGEEFAPAAERGLICKGNKWIGGTMAKSVTGEAIRADSYGDNVGRMVALGYVNMADPMMETDVQFIGIKAVGPGGANAPDGVRFLQLRSGNAAIDGCTFKKFRYGILVDENVYGGLDIKHPHVSYCYLDGIAVHHGAFPPENVTVHHPWCHDNGQDGNVLRAGVLFDSSINPNLVGGRFGRVGEATQRYGYRLTASAIGACILFPESAGNGAGGADSLIDRADALILSRVPSKGTNVARTLAQSGAPVALTGSVAETVLATIAIPANMMGANGSLDVELLVGHTASADLKSIRVKLGGTTLYAVGGTTDPSLTAKVRIFNANATNVQKAQAGFYGYGSTGAGIAAAAIDTTLDTTLTITGQLANAADTVTLLGYSVDLRPRQ